MSRRQIWLRGICALQSLIIVVSLLSLTWVPVRAQELYQQAQQMWSPVNCQQTGSYYQGPNYSSAESNHTGVDLGCGYGTAVVAPLDGIVDASGPGLITYPGVDIMLFYGWDATGWPVYHFFAHLSSSAVVVGQQVKQGQVIGYTGTAGTGPHLHWGRANIATNQFYSYYQHASADNGGKGWMDPLQTPVVTTRFDTKNPPTPVSLPQMASQPSTSFSGQAVPSGEAQVEFSVYQVVNNQPDRSLPAEQLAALRNGSDVFGGSNNASSTGFHIDVKAPTIKIDTRMVGTLIWALAIVLVFVGLMGIRLGSPGVTVLAWGGAVLLVIAAIVFPQLATWFSETVNSATSQFNTQVAQAQQPMFGTQQASPTSRTIINTVLGQKVVVFDVGEGNWVQDSPTAPIMPIKQPDAPFTPGPGKILGKISHYWPALGGTNCSNFVNGQCVALTASGQRWQDWVGKGLACPSKYPFGTRFKVLGTVYTCVDRGGGIVVTASGAVWLDLLVETPPIGYGSEIEVEIEQ